MLYIVKTPKGYPLFLGQYGACLRVASQTSAPTTIDLVYAGCYSLPVDYYDVSAWNKAGDFGYFDDFGFAQLFSVKSRDHWVS